MLVLLFALAGPAAHATTVLAVDVVEQAAESDALVEAVVGKSTVVRTPRMPVTDTQLTIVRVIGGDAPSELVVRQAGGTIDGRTSYLPGDARLEPGQRIAGFIHLQEGHWYFTALGQSVWHIDGEGPKAPVWRDTEGAHFMERDVNGAVVAATQSPVEYANFGELLHAAEGLRFGGGR